MTPEQQELLALMETISEDCYCAGWMMGLERDLYRIAFCGADGGYGMGTVEAPEATRLRELAELSGTWWHWPDGANDPVLMPLKDAAGRWGAP